jgi:hypothetical protein
MAHFLDRVVIDSSVVVVVSGMLRDVLALRAQSARRSGGGGHWLETPRGTALALDAGRDAHRARRAVQAFGVVHEMALVGVGVVIGVVVPDVLALRAQSARRGAGHRLKVARGAAGAMMPRGRAVLPGRAQRRRRSGNEQGGRLSRQEQYPQEEQHAGSRQSSWKSQRKQRILE